MRAVGSSWDAKRGAHAVSGTRKRYCTPEAWPGSLLAARDATRLVLVHACLQCTPATRSERQCEGITILGWDGLDWDGKGWGQAGTGQAGGGRRKRGDGPRERQSESTERGTESIGMPGRGHHWQLGPAFVPTCWVDGVTEQQPVRAALGSALGQGSWPQIAQAFDRGPGLLPLPLGFRGALCAVHASALPVARRLPVGRRLDRPELLHVSSLLSRRRCDTAPGSRWTRRKQLHHARPMQCYLYDGTSAFAPPSPRGRQPIVPMRGPMPLAACRIQIDSLIPHAPPHAIL